jgi:hypothetical protein
MSGQSFIYRHIFIYRVIMNFLYWGKYKKRFTAVIEELIETPVHSKVLELCFGDVYIAEYCRQMRYTWKGIDINKHFVMRAQRYGYDASHADLMSVKQLPTADVCIIIGSFYHFHTHSEALLTKIFNASPTLIISEPVLNLSSRKGLIGFLARKATNAGKGHEEFRYTQASLLSALKTYCNSFNCEIASIRPLQKDLIVKLIKK